MPDRRRRCRAVRTFACMCGGAPRNHPAGPTLRRHTVGDTLHAPPIRASTTEPCQRSQHRIGQLLDGISIAVQADIAGVQQQLDALQTAQRGVTG